MPKLPRLPASAVIAALQRLGFEIVRQKGSHVVLRRPSPNPEGGDTTLTCVVPLHRRDLAVGPSRFRWESQRKQGGVTDAWHSGRVGGLKGADWNKGLRCSHELSHPLA